MYDEEYSIEMESDTINLDFDDIDDGTNVEETDDGQYDNLILE